MMKSIRLWYNFFMEFWAVLIILLLISFFFAVFSLQKELSKPKEIENAKKELSRGRVIFVRKR